MSKQVDPLTLNHPLTLRLLEGEITEKSPPKGCITIALPQRVQREFGTWKKLAIRSEDTPDDRSKHLKLKCKNLNWQSLK